MADKMKINHQNNTQEALADFFVSLKKRLKTIKTL